MKCFFKKLIEPVLALLEFWLIIILILIASIFQFDSSWNDSFSTIISLCLITLVVFFINFRKCLQKNKNNNKKSINFPC
jgi:O-antigen ligase